MRELNQTEQTTFIFSTHDAHVMAYASKIVRIADGRVAEIIETGNNTHDAPRSGAQPEQHGGAR
jgi:putative ABC transport system ATP-binding protein